MRRSLTGFICFAALACSPSPADDAGWSRVDAASFSTELSAPASTPLVIVDVREPELFAAGHIPGAINMPWPDAKTRAPVELNPASRVVLVCHGGPMGDELAGILAGKGFGDVRNLAGGMNGWRGATVVGS